MKRKLLARLIADDLETPAAGAAADSLAVLVLAVKPLDLRLGDALSGRSIATADLKGRVVVLDFLVT